MLPDLEDAAEHSEEEPASRFAAAGNNSVKYDETVGKRPASIMSKAMRGITQRGSGKWVSAQQPNKHEIFLL